MSNTKITSPAKPAKRVAKPAKVVEAAPANANEGDSCELPTPAALAIDVAKSADASKKRFRMLTGVDDSAFCQKVSDALDNGYELYGSPTMTFNGTNVIVGQAVVLKDHKKKLGKKRK